VKNDEKLIANPYVILREEFDDWAILFDPDTGHGFGLSPTGVFVWKLFNGEHTIDTLLEEIRFYAEDVPDEAENHIEAFVEELVREGLAEPNSTVSGLRNNADWTQAHPKENSYSPPKALSDAKRFDYEPPRLVNLNSVQVAHGDCSPVGCSCTNTGSNANTACGGGNSAHQMCDSGSAASQCTGNGSAAIGLCSSFGMSH
jgi:SynChlorMet cassette protein ScmD